MKTIIIDNIEYDLVPTDSGQTTHNDWRLPTVDELMVMFDRETGKPTIDGFIFYYYWSSTTYEGNKRYAWGINFGYGNVYNGTKDDGGYVRCVRDGQDGLEWSKSSENAMNWSEAIDYAKTREGVTNEKNDNSQYLL